MLTFKDTDTQKTYVSTDFHLKHDPKWDNPIWKMRGFNSAIEMTDEIIDSVNNTVMPDDNLIYLGDFCLNTSIEQFEVLISRINCKNIYMLWGNHANPHYKQIYKPLVKTILGEQYTDESEIYPLRYKNIIYLGHYAEVIINGYICVLSHFPLLIWNNVKNGSIQLTGHSHGNCEATNSKNMTGKILDCGWDEFKKPLSFPEILAIVESKRYKSIDHH